MSAKPPNYFLLALATVSVAAMLAVRIGGGQAEPVSTIEKISRQINRTRQVLVRYQANEPGTIWAEGPRNQDGAEFSIALFARAGSGRPVKTFSVKITYDTEALDFIRAQRGKETAAWAGVGANEASPGEVTAGGYTGEPAGAIKPVSIGELCVLRFLRKTDGRVRVDIWTEPDEGGLQPENQIFWMRPTK